MVGFSSLIFVFLTFSISVFAVLMLFAELFTLLFSLRPQQAPAPVNANAAGASKKVRDQTNGVVFFLLIVGLGGYGFLSKSPDTTRQSPSHYSPLPQPVWVNGYYRQDGTFINGHYRTAPDRTDTNNWSTSPNVNPFTGHKGTRSRR